MYFVPVRNGLMSFSYVLLQALAAIPSINSEAVQQRLDRVRTYYELLNLPFEVPYLEHFVFSHILYI